MPDAEALADQLKTGLAPTAAEVREHMERYEAAAEQEFVSIETDDPVERLERHVKRLIRNALLVGDTLLKMQGSPTVIQPPE